ncbi:hypothetical protein TWF718_009699 [Orbilia javanica]|uniref:Uncharacterized protein n=1 Tax=Orbilia javanica TaxID=47235 RepID=A0AAN8RAQ5_9PEZI
MPTDNGASGMDSGTLVPHLDEITVGGAVDRSKYRPLTKSEIRKLSDEEFARYMDQPIGPVGRDIYKRSHVQSSGSNKRKYKIFWNDDDSALFRDWAIQSRWNGLKKAPGHQKFIDFIDDHLMSSDCHKMNPDELKVFHGKIESHVRNWVMKEKPPGLYEPKDDGLKAIENPETGGLRQDSDIEKDLADIDRLIARTARKNFSLAAERVLKSLTKATELENRSKARKRLRICPPAADELAPESERED